MIRPVPKPVRRERIQKPRKITRIESNPTEDIEQMTVVDWLRANKINFTASANGIYSNALSMSKMKRLGVERGFPDIIITSPVPTCNHIRGVAIEMKRRKGSHIDPDQMNWRDKLNCDGWLHKFAFGCDEAIEYLKSLGYGRRA